MEVRVSIRTTSLRSVTPRVTCCIFAAQRRNTKTISSIERDLVTARDSISTQKFEGQLAPVVSATTTTEIGKERFLTLLERRVEEHG